MTSTGTYRGVVTIPIVFTVADPNHFEDAAYKAVRRWIEDNYIDVAHLEKIEDSTLWEDHDTTM